MGLRNEPRNQEQRMSQATTSASSPEHSAKNDHPRQVRQAEANCEELLTVRSFTAETNEKTKSETGSIRGLRWTLNEGLGKHSKVLRRRSSFADGSSLRGRYSIINALKRNRH